VTATGSRLRFGVWVLHLSLPLLGLWLLVAQPAVDAALHWQHNPSHFVLMLVAAALSGGVALQIRREARARIDARLVLIALAFFTAAGFLGLHGLATPGVILAGPNTGFEIAAPVGLTIAALLAVWSSAGLDRERSAGIVRAEPWLLAGLVGLMAGWAAASVAGIGVFGEPFDEAHGGWLSAFVYAGVAGYGVAAVRYWLLYRRRPAVMLVSLITAFALLAEAQVAVLYGRNWQGSWWSWHVLTLVAFAFVAYSAHVQYRREGTARGLFAGASLEQTVRRIREEHRTALEELVEAMRHHDEGANIKPLTARLAARFELTEAQAAVLEGAAEATYEVDNLRRQLDTLLHFYVSPDVADTLIADPTRADLGGATAEVTVLFADLRGFTPFAERTPPAQVVELLNRYFQRAVPLILSHGGTVVQFVGDAVMAVFNAPKPLADHALAAARAGLAMQEAITEEIGGNTDLPRFRVGINTGPALVGNIGGQVRNFTAIGDTTNLAARLEGIADPGQVVIGASTRAALGDQAVVTSLGPLDIKGKAQPVEAYVLEALNLSPPAAM
jgi:adenylate cyclase